MVPEVFFYPLPAANPAQAGLEVPLDLEAGLKALVQALLAQRKEPFCETLGLKTFFGKPRRPAKLSYAWHQTLAEALAPGKKWRIFDTLSITTKGLDEPASFLETAGQKGFSSCIVADDPGLGKGFPGVLPQASSLRSVTCAAGLKLYDGLGVLNPVRPHPHLGYWGMVPTLGLGLVDRQTKLVLHEDVRPKVNTPLCAGCGSCLDVCIFDAIRINGGRAAIDHTLCTGCGECMDACFMGGIAPGTFGEVETFQKNVADAAAAMLALRTGEVACFNFLVGLDRSNGAKKLEKLGIWASFDPVALDQAAWDVITGDTVGNLATWSGFSPDPGVMLDRAVELGLGLRQYNLTKVLPKK